MDSAVSMPHPDPAARTRSKVTTLYSETAAGYQELWAPELAPLSRQLLPHLPLEEARRIVDGGAGVGTLLPELRSVAPQATIVAADLSFGMLRLAPRGFPRLVSDASALALKDGSFDVGVLAFVLFHLFDPQRGVAELSRVLRRGGHVGTVTWGDENDPVAYQVWAEELERHGAPAPDPDLARFEAVDTPAKVRDLMAAHGLNHIRSWIGEYRARLTLDQFIVHRTRHGQSHHRFSAMPPDARSRFLDAVRIRLEPLSAEDFEETSEVVYVVGRKS